MSDFSALKRIETNGPEGQGLTLWPEMNPADLAAGAPVQKGHLYDEDAGEDYSAGVWDCTAFDDKPGPYSVDEFMLLLEGTVVMVMPEGEEVVVSAGEAFVIPKGFECQWKMPETVRKIFMILDGAAPGTANNPSLSRITKLTEEDLTDTARAAPPAVSSREVHFLNHDARMSVYTETFPKASQGPAPSADRQIVHVVAGDVAFSDDPAHRFVAGESFYLSPGHSLAWSVSAGTRLLVSSCRPPAA